MPEGTWGWGPAGDEADEIQELDGVREGRRSEAQFPLFRGAGAKPSKGGEVKP